MCDRRLSLRQGGRVISGKIEVGVHKIGAGHLNNLQNWISRFKTKIKSKIFQIWCCRVQVSLRGENLRAKNLGWKLMRKKLGGGKNLGKTLEGEIFGSPLGQVVVKMLVGNMEPGCCQKTQKRFNHWCQIPLEWSRFILKPNPSGRIPLHNWSWPTHILSTNSV